MIKQLPHKVNIIVVDDNFLFLEGITTYLNSITNYEVQANFSSGNELLANINSYDPDLILLDIKMPGLSGIETARRLSDFGMHLKLVAITMNQDTIYIKELIDSGFMGFVHKNNIYEELLFVIDSLLNNKLAFTRFE
jgi:DNA-binding NarL/FixJ family response regulator